MPSVILDYKPDFFRQLKRCLAQFRANGDLHRIDTPVKAACQNLEALLSDEDDKRIELHIINAYVLLSYLESQNVSHAFQAVIREVLFNLNTVLHCNADLCDMLIQGGGHSVTLTYKTSGLFSRERTLTLITDCDKVASEKKQVGQRVHQLLAEYDTDVSSADLALVDKKLLRALYDLIIDPRLLGSEKEIFFQFIAECELQKSGARPILLIENLLAVNDFDEQEGAVNSLTFAQAQRVFQFFVKRLFKVFASGLMPYHLSPGRAVRTLDKPRLSNIVAEVLGLFKSATNHSDYQLHLLKAGGGGLAFVTERQAGIAPFVMKTARSTIDSKKSDCERLLGFFRHQQYLLQEAEILKACNHEHIVNFYRLDMLGPIAVLQMEYVERGDIRMLRQSGKIPRKEYVLILYQVVLALIYLHSLAIVHCDLHPSNICLDEDGRVKLVDFGQARRYDLIDLAALRCLDLGAVNYCAAEKAGKFLNKDKVEVDLPTACEFDLQSLAMVGFFLATGHDLVDFLKIKKGVSVNLAVLTFLAQGYQTCNLIRFIEADAMSQEHQVLSFFWRDRPSQERLTALETKNFLSSCLKIGQ